MSSRIGPYTVLGELGRGAMGIVVRARDDRLGREVAIKLLLAQEKATRWERFRREAAALSRLDHPGVVPVFEVGLHEGRPYLVMPLVQGESLEARVQRQGPLPPAEAARILGILAEAVDHAHGLGLIHRDLKPANVLLDERGAPRLVDFGLVRDLGDARRLSSSGVSMGTPGFWSPEQATGQHDQVGPSADVYGLGATLYYALTGEPPFDGDSLVAVIAAQAQGPPRPPSQLRPGTPPALDAVCLVALALEPRGRYASASAFAAALDVASRGARPRRRRAGQRGRRALAIGAGLALVAGVLALVLFDRGRVPAGARSAPPTVTAPPAPALDDRSVPWNPAALAVVRRALDALDAGDLDAARRLADESLAREPRCIDALIVLCRVAELEGDVPRALAHYDHALRLEPGRADLINSRGFLLLRAGEPGAAAAEFLRAIPLAPGDVQVRINLGLAYERLGDFARARDAADDAARVGPTNPFPFNNRGYARLQLGDLTGAAADFDHALELDPTCTSALGNRAALRLGGGGFAGALADLDELVRLTPGDHRARAQRGAALAGLRRYDEALVELDGALRGLDPDDPFRRTVLAWRARAEEHRAGR